VSGVDVRRTLALLSLLAVGSAVAVGLFAPRLAAARGDGCVGAREHHLPLPSAVAAAQFVDYERQILGFLQRGEYRTLGWCVDKGVRDTGPFLAGVYYGTHPAVRIFYSPSVMRWLLAGRQGALPDGAMIIKEQYHPPAARYAGLGERDLPRVSDWTVMIKDAQGSKDGWFWGEFFDTMTFDDDRFPFQYPWAGFGLYCLRCHATAEREHTFATLDNVEGFPGRPLTFADDGSWRGTGPGTTRHARRFASPRLDASLPDPEFLRIFDAIPAVPLASVQALPSETYDHVVPPGAGPGRFVTSTQCQGCHSALNGPFGPVMFLPSGPPENGVPAGANVSPYGEWRWSPMGLAGRDPVFFAQLESEVAYFKTLPPAKGELLTTAVRNTCVRCHGVMGKRQLDTDSGGSGDFRLDLLQLTDRDDPRFRYGALARDGISCAVCHRAVPTPTPPGVTPLEHFLRTSITGQFQVGPPETIFGPFPDAELAPYAMHTATGITPRFGPYIQSSRLCGSCHTIDLPVLDGAPGQMSIEQATYLEWLNSRYQTEFGLPGPAARTCQGCHMPEGYHSARKGLDVPRLQEKIAIIGDETYPEAEERVPIEDITIRVRDGFRRHEFLGLNVFLLELFRQFFDVLGVRIPDYMSGSISGLPDAIDNAAQQARERTARIAASARAIGPGRIEADVAVTNLAGHRLPSGVGFRRAFLEVLVKDGRGDVVWASGRTNALGIIVDGRGEILPSEFFRERVDVDGRVSQHHQPHHEVITAEDQVQIYEELTKDSDGRFTTNFTRRFEIVKDNRLLPIGWTEHGPDPSLNGRFLAATHPEGSAADDPDYRDGLGTDRVAYRVTLPAGVDAATCTVQATLYYQATPPYYLDQRFRAAPHGDATRRLYYLASNLTLAGRPAEHWKLPIVSTATAVAAPSPAGRP
jgi:mono/diheme cytochrome c family protein